MTNPTELVAPSEEMVARIGLAIEEAWNGSGSEGQRNNLPPIDLTEHERRHLGRAALSVILPEGWVAVPLVADACMEKAALRKVAPYHDLSADDWDISLPKDLFRLAWPAMISAATSGKEGA